MKNMTPWHKIAERRGYKSEEAMLKDLAGRYTSAYTLAASEFPGLNTDTIRSRLRRHGIDPTQFRKFRMIDLAQKHGYRSIKALMAAKIKEHGEDEKAIAEDLGVTVEIVRSTRQMGGNHCIYRDTIPKIRNAQNRYQGKDTPCLGTDDDLVAEEHLKIDAATGPDFRRERVWGKIIEKHLAGWDIEP